MSWRRGAVAALLALAPGPVRAAFVLPSQLEEEAYARLIVEAFFRSEGVYAYGVFDPAGDFRPYYPRFGRPDLLGPWAPRVEYGADARGAAEITALTESKDGRQLSHLLKNQANLTGFIIHAWFRTPESLRQAPPAHMLETSAVKNGYFYAALRMTRDETLAFAKDVREQIAAEPDNLALKMYYRLQIQPALAP